VAGNLNHPVRTASALDYLVQLYGPNITLSQLSSITTQGIRTIQNAIVKGDYPIPSFKIGGKRVFRLVDVADYLDRQFAATNNAVASNRHAGTTARQPARRKTQGGR